MFFIELFLSNLLLCKAYFENGQFEKAISSCETTLDRDW